MGNPEIKRWDNGDIIIPAGKYASLKEAVEKEYKNLRFADLCFANLCFANLHSADLCFANLRSADLRYANLHSADLHSADLSYANLRSADLSYADLRSANLRSANLSYADLSSADLSSANLRSADLSSADLRSANLRSANLSSAKGINKYITTNLYMLLDQPDKIIAYKIVNEKNEGIYNGGIIYEIGKTYEVKDADTNEQNECGKGINLATLNWCLREYKKGYKILMAEFTKEEIAAIPIGSDGKFRVSKCKIVGEKNLEELGV